MRQPFWNARRKFFLPPIQFKFRTCSQPEPQSATYSFYKPFIYPHRSHGPLSREGRESYLRERLTNVPFQAFNVRCSWEEYFCDPNSIV
jgi:hypothetical protein